MALFTGVSVLPASQSVALAGTFTSTIVSVDVNERALVLAGYSGVLGALPIQAEVFDDSGVSVQVVSLARVSNGVWVGSIAAPTVAGGVTLSGVVCPKLGAIVVNAAGAQLIAPATTQRVSTPVRWARAAS